MLSEGSQESSHSRKPKTQVKRRRRATVELLLSASQRRKSDDPAAAAAKPRVYDAVYAGSVYDVTLKSRLGLTRPLNVVKNGRVERRVVRGSFSSTQPNQAHHLVSS